MLYSIIMWCTQSAEKEAGLIIMWCTQSAAKEAGPQVSRHILGLSARKIIARLLQLVTCQKAQF